MEVPLVGDDQWDALEEALNTEGLRALYVASDCPFLDNSINDAKYKMTQPEQRDVCHTWPAHGGDLLRLLGLLEDWEAEAYERRVFFLAGGATCGLDTELISKRLSNAADDATAAALREAKEREDAEAKEKEEAAKVETEEEKKRKEREKKKAERGGAFAKMRAKAAGAYKGVKATASDGARVTSSHRLQRDLDESHRSVQRSAKSACMSKCGIGSPVDSRAGEQRGQGDEAGRGRRRGPAEAQALAERPHHGRGVAADLRAPGRPGAGLRVRARGDEGAVRRDVHRGLVRVRDHVHDARHHAGRRAGQARAGRPAETAAARVAQAAARVPRRGALRRREGRRAPAVPGHGAREARPHAHVRHGRAGPRRARGRGRRRRSATSRRCPRRSSSRSSATAGTPRACRTRRS